MALGLAARAKRRCLNLCNDIRACGMEEEGPAHRHDQFVIWSSLFEQRWSISGGRRGRIGTECDTVARINKDAGPWGRPNGVSHDAESEKTEPFHNSVIVSLTEIAEQPQNH